MSTWPSPPQPGGKPVEGPTLVKVAEGFSLFTAVKVLFKSIKYFQPRHLSVGIIIILFEHTGFATLMADFRGSDDRSLQFLWNF